LRRRCLAVGERRSTPLASPPWGELSRAPRRRGRGRRPRRAPRWPMRAPEHDDPTPPDPEPDLEALRRYLLSASQACIRPPIDRFRHPWIAPMPPSRATAELLDARRTRQDPPPTPTARSMR